MSNIENAARVLMSIPAAMFTVTGLIGISGSEGTKALTVFVDNISPEKFDAMGDIALHWVSSFALCVAIIGASQLYVLFKWNAIGKSARIHGLMIGFLFFLGMAYISMRMSNPFLDQKQKALTVLQMLLFTTLYGGGIFVAYQDKANPGNAGYGTPLTAY